MQKNTNFGLLGSNISYSLSPKIYNYWFKEYSINATYQLLDIKENELNSDFFSNLIINCNGFNITKPFKEKIIPFLPNLSKEVEFIKSVNLVVNNVGYNTDYLGLLDSYKYYSISPLQKNILILGAGGASRALLYSLKDFDCNIYIYNRTKEKIIKIIADFSNLKIFPYKENLEFDIIFNATSTSFEEILKHVNIKKHDNIIYYDLNYYHNSTKEFQHIDGLYMLLAQAKYNFKKFFGILPQVNQQLLDYIKTK